MTIITPYDNKVAIWHHKGESVAEQTIDDIAYTIQRLAPAVTQVFVKTSDGSDWQGLYDSKKSMSIDGPESIRNWVTTLQKYGLEFHAWCVPKGLNVDGESSVMIQACQVPGVRSLILDVEPYQGFYQGPRDSIRPLMSKVRAALPSTFHIGMTVDPRSSHYAAIYPDEWFPFINSVHMQLYWGDFQRTVEATLADGYSTWQKFNRPLFPVLQGHLVDANSANRARTLAVQTYKSVGASWWVLGAITQAEFGPVNHYVNGAVGSPPPGADGKPVQTGVPVMVSVSGTGYNDGAYDGVPPAKAVFGTYASVNGGTGKFHATDEGVSNVWARYNPQIKTNGWYRIEAFIPNQHATTGNARYKLHGVQGQSSEVILSVPQAYYNNTWAMLGTFLIDASASEAGVVYLNDWTFEPNLELAFDAIRWTPVFA